MKKALLILSLLSIISCNNSHDSKPLVAVNATIIRAYDTIDYLNDTLKTRLYEIELYLRNISGKPISLWLMTCSREDNFIINNDYTYFRNPGCDSNVPVIYHLKPDDRLNWNTTMIKYYHSRYQFIKTTRFGLIYIDSLQCRSITDYENIIGDKSRQDKIIWSNPIYLDDLK